VLAATLEEAWIVAREISARVGGDPGFQGLSGPREAPRARDLKTLVVLETAGSSSLDPEGAKVFNKFRDLLGRKGVRFLTRENTSAVAEAEDAIRDAGALSRKINAWEFRWPLNTYARDLDVNGLSEIMRDRLKEAESMTLEGYQASLVERTRCREIYARLASISDACITLAASGPAPIGLQSTGDPTFAIPASLLGVPALSLPLFQIGGLPFGLQILGFLERDAELFGVAAAANCSLKAMRQRVEVNPRSWHRPVADWRSLPSSTETGGHVQDLRQSG
jgi:Asp-tRNA(Asn)/Glu-tRNA(Gln) amidotransferase A subunit family amidase